MATFNAHNAKMELIRMLNDGMLTHEEWAIAWDIVDDAEQDHADAQFEARLEAGYAKSAFYWFCEEGPGAHAATILANMAAVNDGSKRFWKRALFAAQLARKTWLAA